MNTKRQIQALAVVLCAATAGTSVTSAGPDSRNGRGSDAPAATQMGNWRSHQVDFWFMGFTAIYSCDGLSERLSSLLRQVGASSVEVIPFCSRFGPDKLAEAQLRFTSLQPATASSSPASNHAVRGVWRHVDLAPHKPVPLTGGDCDLIEQFRRQLLPFFATHNLKSDLACGPRLGDYNKYSLSFDVFVPAPDRKP